MRGLLLRRRCLLHSRTVGRDLRLALGFVLGPTIWRSARRFGSATAALRVGVVFPVFLFVHHDPVAMESIDHQAGILALINGFFSRDFTRGVVPPEVVVQ